MAKTIQKQQRFPEPLLRLIDEWAKESNMDRTAAVNHMCKCFLEAIEIEKLRLECSRLNKEAAELRGKVVALAMTAPRKVKMCGESRCHYDPAEVEEVLTCDECPFEIEVDDRDLEHEAWERSKICAACHIGDCGGCDIAKANIAAREGE